MKQHIMNFMNKKASFFLILFGIYLLSTGVSYAFFNFVKPEKIDQLSSLSTEVTKGPKGNFPVISGPKDQTCPINGGAFTKMEKDLWEKRRPLLVMIENHEDSRPQSGLSMADVVYEAVAEGAITRLMAVFYCGSAAYSNSEEYDVGPVRSARTYFLDWASEYGDYPLYVHVGGAGLCNDPTVDPRAKALCQIEKYGWKNKENWSDLDQFSLGFKVCRREPDRTGKPVATEHSMYCSTGSLLNTAANRNLTNVNAKNVLWNKNFRSWLFKSDSPSSGSVSPEYEFWRDYKAYAVKWEYDKSSNSYKRYNGGQLQEDFNNKQTIVAKNVVVLFTKEKGPIDEHKHMLYETTGNGRALIFQDGLVIDGKWSKKSRVDRTIFTDNKGREIKFNGGLTWISILPTTGKVNY